MEFASNKTNSSASLDANPSGVPLDASYKHCLLSSVWTQSRLIASLLDQSGLAYHRVFEPQALELFLVLINTELTTCYSLDNFNVPALTVLNQNLLTVQSKLISSMDLFVVESFKNQQTQHDNTKLVDRLKNKHHQWKSCPKSRFEQVICPILEQKLTHNKAQN